MDFSDLSKENYITEHQPCSDLHWLCKKITRYKNLFVFLGVILYFVLSSCILIRNLLLNLFSNDNMPVGRR